MLLSPAWLTWTVKLQTAELPLASVAVYVMGYVPAVKIPGWPEGVTVGLGSTLSVAVGAVHATKVCVCPWGIVATTGAVGHPANTGGTVSAAIQKNYKNINSNNNNTEKNKLVLVCLLNYYLF